MGPREMGPGFSGSGTFPSLRSVVETLAPPACRRSRGRKGVRAEHTPTRGKPVRIS